MTALIPRPRADVAPGAVHVPGWLDAEEQRRLLDACRGWARPPAGMRRTRLPGGGTMSVRTVCLGRHWVPYRYQRTADDGTAVKAFPDWLAVLGRRAVTEACVPKTLPGTAPPDLGLRGRLDVTLRESGADSADSAG
jgi:alkylated DNA repair protein (DNA oxidative demethylase)